MTQRCANLFRHALLISALMGLIAPSWADSSAQIKRRRELTKIIESNMPWRFARGSADGFFTFPPRRDTQKAIPALVAAATQADVPILGGMLSEIEPDQAEANPMAYVLYHALFDLGQSGRLAVYEYSARPVKKEVIPAADWLRTMRRRRADLAEIVKPDVQILKPFFLRTFGVTKHGFYDLLDAASSAQHQGKNGSFALCFDEPIDEVTFFACRQTLYLARAGEIMRPFASFCETIQTSTKPECVAKIEQMVETRLGLAPGAAKAMRGDAVSKW